jgi:pyridinium-3,5-biscarboxylic acid mononucleotide sulfurtransferase
MTIHTEQVVSTAKQLMDRIRSFNSVAIAFSGGVDSAVVAAAAYQALGDRAVAITGIGTAVAASELDDARQVAKAIGIQHVELSTLEINDENYVRNDAKRCYFCKTNLYGALRQWADANRVVTLLSGTNADDLSDYRPGLVAAKEWQVIAPLVDLGITKSTVRELASFFNLAIAQKPASPCLASRIAYGQAVTSERLSSIQQSEAYLKSIGFIDVRVRLHADSLVRLELNLDDLVLACEPSTRSAITHFMRGLGFKFVTLDLMGRQSGSLNQVLPIVTLRE